VQVGQAVACAASLTSDEKVIGSDAPIFDAPGITLPFVDLYRVCRRTAGGNLDALSIVRRLPNHPRRWAIRPIEQLQSGFEHFMTLSSRDF
jgi:hypothetical protein